jgi:hypothetical protein
MSDATAQIKIDIVASGAEAGANKVNAALDKINGKSRSVRAANDNLASTFDKIGKSMGGAAAQGSVLGSVFDEIRNKSASATPVVGNLISNLARFGPMAAVIGTVAVAIAAVGSEAIKAATQVQIWKANLLTVTKSSEAAGSAYAALVNFANTTPFTLGQSVEGFIKLRALGLATSTDIMTSYGNTAAAMGKNMSQMIEAVADATTGEFERLKEFGIKASTEGNKVKFTFQGVTKEVGKNSKEIQDYIVGIGKTNFGGSMERQMATISGAFANLSDKVFLAFAAIGEGELGKSIANIANTIADGVGKATPLLAGIGNILGGIVSVVWSLATAFGQMTQGIVTNSDNGYSAIEKISIILTYVGQGIGVLGSIAGQVFGFIGQVVGTTASYIQSAFGTVFGWLIPSFEVTGQSAGESLVGILRAAQFVANQLPNIFKAALNEIKGAFIQAGDALAKSLTGDFSGWGKIDLSMKKTKETVASVWKGAKATFGNQKANRAWIDNAAGRTGAGNINFGAMGKDKPAGAKPSKDSGASDAERKAKAEAEFWKTLQGEVETAKLLPVQAENHRKELELQKIVGRDINAAEKARLADLLHQTRVAKLLTGLAVDHQKASLDIGEAEALLALRRAGATDGQLDVEKAILEKRSAAIIAGATQADLQTDAWKAAEAQLRSDLERLGVLGQQNKALDDQAAKLRDMARDGFSYANEALKTGGSVADRQGVARADYEKTLANLRASRDSKDPKDRLSAAAFQAGVKKAGDEFRRTMSEIGDEFSQKMGRVGDFLSNIGSMMGGKLGAIFGKAGDVTKGIGDFSKTQNDVANQFGRAFGDNSPFLKGMGKAVGGAMAGMKIGESIAGLGKALGVKMSSTGSQIGGALGSAFGPLGSIIGSIGGGLIGGLFKKAKYGTAVLTGSGDPVISGNKSAYKSAASGAAGSVQDGLAQLAAELGGELGAYNVSIGQYKGKWRVSTTGRTGKLKDKYAGVEDFGKEGEAAAIEFAIQDAIKDGAIKGLSSIIQKALSGLGADAAVQFAKDWTAAMADYKSMIDPVGAAVDAIIKPLDNLKKTMLQVGASSDELARFEDYRAKKLEAALKDSVSGFQSLLDDLRGDMGGVTALNQLSSNLAKFGQFEADIAAGKSVDQDAFTALAQKIMGNADDAYGTNTSDYQNIVARITGATNGAIGNATTSFNNAANASTSAAIADQTNALTAQIGISNDYLRQIANAVNNLGLAQAAPSTGNNVGVKNGREVNAY